jgi:hypothetical protein
MTSTGTTKYNIMKETKDKMRLSDSTGTIDDKMRLSDSTGTIDDKMRLEKS